MENQNLNQAINFSKQVIFVAIPKCGTTTIRKQLKEFHTDRPFISNSHLDIQQIKQLFYFQQLKNSLEKNETFPSTGVLDNIGIKNTADVNFNKMFKFSLVRNPWSRVVSLYHRREGLKFGQDMNFTEFCENIKYASDSCRQPTLHRNQLDWLTDEDGNIGVDYIGKLEEFDKAIKDIYTLTNGRIKLTNTPKNVNPASPIDYKKMYNDYTKVLIEKTFSKDISFFNYIF
jgi:hypothetical protein